MVANMCVPILVQYWLIARFFFNNFKVYTETLLLSLGLHHSSEIKLPYVALGRLKSS